MTTLVTTLWGYVIVSHSEQQQTQKNIFDYRVESIKLAIKNRIISYQQILQSGVGLFAVSEIVGRKEWHQFIKYLEIDERYPGIQGVGFSKVIFSKEKESHLQEIQAEGGFFLDYYIKPEGQREQYTPTIYLEPLDKRNQAAIGYDMFFEPTQRAAMERARDTGQAALSGKVSLEQEIEEHKQAGFLLYLPVYRNNAPLQTIQERQAALLGYVYSPFRMNDFMRGIFGNKPSEIDIHIYDGNCEEDIMDNQFMYDEVDHQLHNDSLRHAQFKNVERFHFAGHTWTIYFYSLPEFETSTQTHAPRIILLGGVLVSVLLFGFTHSFETARLVETEHKLILKLQKEIIERKKIERALRASEERFDLAMRGSSDGLWDWNVETNEVYFSPRWKEMLGYEINEIKNELSEWTKRVHPDDLEHAIIAAKQHLNKETSVYQSTHRIRHKNGYYIWVLDRGIAIWNAEGKAIRMVGTHTDLTPLKHIELELRSARQFSDDIINSLPGIFYMLDNNGYFVRHNSNLNEIIGRDSDRIVGRSVLSVIEEKDREIVCSKIKEVFEKGETFVEAKLLDKFGNALPYYFSGKRIYLQDQLYLIGLGLDITERKQMEKELLRLANTDFLTGLKNRRYFMEKMEEKFKLLRYRNLEQCSVLMLDLDHFKQINDTYGHAVGDAVLKHFSALLQDNLRQMDIVGRLGGEEFGILLPQIDINEAQQCGERLREIVATSPIVENNNVISITVSIGISMFRESEQRADAALTRADDALFIAKNKGRNTIQIVA